MKKINISAAVAMIICLLMLAGFFSYKYYSTVYVTEKNIKDAENAQKELFEKIAPRVNDILTDFNDSNNDISDNDIGSIVSEDLLSACTDINSDTVGWIIIPGTNIDYPIMQCGDNDFYLHNGADGYYNYELGCPFLDFRCEKDMSGFNSIIYGHHITYGRMFADVVLYDSESFFDSHNIGYLVLPDEVRKVDFFSYLCVPSNSAIYNTVFLSSEDYENYIDLLFFEAKYSKKFTRDDLKKMDDLHFLLLSTCTYGEGNLRSVLVGVF